MAKASIHIIPIKENSEIHNKRLKDYDYVRKELSHLNESWESESLKEARQRIERNYKNSTGQKMQKKATPIREGVVNLNSNHSMKDLHRLKDELENKFGIKIFQIYIHRDEGHHKAKVWKPNLHAHLIFDWTDEKGKSIKLNRFKMSEMQDMVAQVLQMERGQRSNKKHLNAIEFKIQAKEREMQEKMKEVKEFEEKLREFQKAIHPKMSVENFEERGIFGAKKLSREKIEEFIQQASAQSVLYKKLQEDLSKSNEELRKMIDLINLQTSEKKILDNRLRKAENEVKELQQKLDFPTDKYLYEKGIEYDKREKEMFQKGLEDITKDIQKNFLKYQDIMSLDNLYRKYLGNISQRKTIWELMNKYYKGGQFELEWDFQNMLDSLVETYEKAEKQMKNEQEQEQETKLFRGMRR